MSDQCICTEWHGVIFHADVPMLSCSRVSHVPSSENLSTDVQETQPAGELHDKLMRSSHYFLFNNFTGMVDGDDRGSMSKIVVSDDGKSVYLFNPFSRAYTGSWMKMDFAGGDTLVAHFPQPILRDEDGTVFYAYPMKYYVASRGEYTQSQLVLDTLDNGKTRDELRFVYRNDSLIQLGDQYIGLVSESLGWTGYGDSHIAVGRMDYQRMEPTVEEKAKAEDIIFSCTDEDKNRKYLPGKAIIEDGVVYLRNPYTDDDQQWIKGTIIGNKATFLSNQYLGEHESLNHYMFAIGASYGIVSQKDPYWGGSYDTYNYEFAPSFTMDYDAATKTFSTDTSDSSVLMVNCSPDRVFFIASYISPKITMLHQGPKTPQKPVINVSKSADYDEEYGKGWIEFNASKVDVNGDYMPVENLYYRVFVDGSTTAYTFKADDYGSIKTDTTAIPVTKNDGFYFTERESGNDYVVSFDYFIEQYKSIGVQLVYHYDGKDYPSEMAYFGEPLTAISAVMANSKATKVKYYGLNGRELKGSYKGVAIKKEMVDGHVVRATKVIR